MEPVFALIFVLGISISGSITLYLWLRKCTKEKKERVSLVILFLTMIGTFFGPIIAVMTFFWQQQSQNKESSEPIVMLATDYNNETNSDLVAIFNEGQRFISIGGFTYKLKDNIPIDRIYDHDSIVGAKNGNYFRLGVINRNASFVNTTPFIDLDGNLIDPRAGIKTREGNAQGDLYIIPITVYMKNSQNEEYVACGVIGYYFKEEKNVEQNKINIHITDAYGDSIGMPISYQWSNILKKDTNFKLNDKICDKNKNSNFQ